MSKDDPLREKIKDYLVITLLILYLVGAITATLNPNLSKSIIIDLERLEDLEQILELGN